jgi:type I restriction enzyme, R subunit
MAKIYYNEFQKQIKDLPSDKQLKVATIFSYTANEEEPDGTTDENPEDTSKLDQTSRDFLESAIKDYNKMF